MTRTLLAAVTLAAVTLLSGVATAPAFAHTSLIGSEPADESSVEALPDVVSLAFSGKVQEPAFVVVTDPDGTEIQRGTAVIEGMYVRQKIDGGDATGTHTITYRVVSADGHPVQGTITTEVGPEQTDAPDETPAADETETPSADSKTAPASDDKGTASYLPITIGLLVLLGALMVGRMIVRRQRR